MFSDMFGAHRVPGRIWTPQVELSPDNVGSVPPGEFRVDQYLSAIGTDPFDMSAVIAIGSGRFVSVGNAASINGGNNGYRLPYTAVGRTPLTLHDGRYLTPAGMAVNQMYKEPGPTSDTLTEGGASVTYRNPDAFMTRSNTVRYRKGFLAGVPYVAAVNNAYGTIVSGDRLTGYFGSTTSETQVTNLHRGKPVKWVQNVVYTQTSVSSALVALSAAVYPGIQPTLIMARTNSAIVAASSGTLTWNSVLACWTALFHAAVTEVTYSYGQSADQIAGEVQRIQSITDILNTDNMLRWQEYIPQDYLNYPPAAQRVPVTQVGTGTDPANGSNWESATQVTANRQYRTTYYPISVHHPVLVAIQGTITDVRGSTSTYSGSTWYVLPTSAIADNRGYFIGQYHTVNWRTGLIELSTAISSITAIKTLYAYINDPRDGAVLWGGGVLGLTDGSNLSTFTVNGVTDRGYGTPAHLNVTDAIGELRVWVY